MTDHASPEVAAVETVGGVLTDLVEVAERLPVLPGQAEPVARILDRLSEEIREAAGMLRTAGSPARVQPVTADPRLTSARELLAERHQPLTMAPGDLRNLLARYQRRLVQLMDVLDRGDADPARTARS